MNFTSDNAAPAHPAIMETLARANEGFAPSYGADAIMELGLTPDVIIGYARQPGRVLFNESAGKNFRAVEWNNGDGAVYGLAIADLDGDGWPDIAAARSDAPNGVWFSGPANP